MLRNTKVITRTETWNRNARRWTESSEIGNRLGCSLSTINRMLGKFTATGSVNDIPRPGPQRVTTPEQDREIRLDDLRDKFWTAELTTRRTTGRHNYRMADSTAQRRLREKRIACQEALRGNVLTPDS